MQGAIPTIAVSQIADIVDGDVEPAIVGKRRRDRGKSVFLLRRVCNDEAGIGRQFLGRVSSRREVNRRAGRMKCSDSLSPDAGTTSRNQNGASLHAKPRHPSSLL